LFGFNFPPRSWAFCDGQILPISQNQALFSLLGTTCGGDGRTTFALPDLRGRVPMHVGSSGGANHPLGQRAGEEFQPLSLPEIPAHTHPVAGGTGQDQEDPAGSYPGTAEDNTYNTASNPTFVPLASNTIGNSGAGTGHENRQPFLALNFSIALNGTFPSR
jgi:microcystin-dependent protein